MDREVYDRLLLQELQSRKVDFVCLAGFMRLLSATFIRQFPNRISNIHPSLLPAFPGLDAQHQALNTASRSPDARFILSMRNWMPDRS